MIDLHCHILPGVDDGAGNEEISRRMLALAAAAGVDKIAASSHAEGFSAGTYRPLWERWQKIAREEYHIELIPALEYDYNTLAKLRHKNAESEIQLLNDRRFLLVDFAIGLLPGNWMNLLNWPKLADFQSLICVHPERLFNNALKTCAELDQPEVFFQINAGSVTGYYGPAARRQAFRLIDAGYCHLIAGDQHSAQSGVWRLAQARAILEKRCGREAVIEWFDANPQRILEGRHPRRVIPHVSWIHKLLHRYGF